jgi:hypothetical protein
VAAAQADSGPQVVAAAELRRSPLLLLLLLLFLAAGPSLASLRRPLLPPSPAAIAAAAAVCHGYVAAAHVDNTRAARRGGAICRPQAAVAALHVAVVRELAVRVPHQAARIPVETLRRSAHRGGHGRYGKGKGKGRGRGRGKVKAKGLGTGAAPWQAQLPAAPATGNNRMATLLAHTQPATIAPTQSQLHPVSPDLHAAR